MLDYETEERLISNKQYKEYFEQYYQRFIEVHYSNEKFYGYTQEEIEWDTSRKYFVSSMIFDLPDNLLDRADFIIILQLYIY